MPNGPNTASVAKPRDGDEKPTIVLGVLNAVHKDSRLTQRSLARELGIALGITNTYLRRCVEKGYVKVRQVPPRRYLYYVTARGFREKSRLTAQYLSDSFTFFRQARSECEALLVRCAEAGWHNVVLAGAGELAEIHRLCAAEIDVRLVAIVDPSSGAPSCAGLSIVRDLADLAEEVDAIIVTDLSMPQQTYDAIRLAAAAKGLPEERVLVPAILDVSERPQPRGPG